MYNLLIFRNLRKIVYVTLICFLSSTYAQEKNIDKEKKFTQARQLVLQLGANSYKKRKAAIKGLIDLGYFARAEVKKVLNSKDPEIKENAKAVWDKIRWAVTENNPKLVNDFIEKYKENRASVKNWVELVEKCGSESIDVLMEISENIQIPEKVELQQEIIVDPFADEGFADEETRNFGYETMLPIITNMVTNDDLKNSVIGYNSERKNKLLKIFKYTVQSSSPYSQSQLIILTSKVFGDETAWKLYHDCDATSNYIVRMLPASLKTYISENLDKMDSEGKIRALTALAKLKKLTPEMLGESFNKDVFHQSGNITQKVFFEHVGTSLAPAVLKKTLEAGNEPWHRYKLLTLEKEPDIELLTKTFREIFSKNGDIVEFIEENFPMGSEKAIPFYLIDSELDSKSENWFLYSTSNILMKHFHRIGDFESAIKFLRLFNHENERIQDTNEAFFNEQLKKINKETVELLKKVQPILHKEPENALKLLSKAAAMSPEVLTIKIQQVEALIDLKKKDEAKKLIQEIETKVPMNLLEIRDLVYLCWAAGDKETAEKLIKKLNLSDENYYNITLASSNYEFFLNMDKVDELQKNIGSSSFAKTRRLFYEKQYEQIPPICLMPDEGDFQYIWGVISKRITDNKLEALKYYSQRVFDETWPEMLGLCLAGKITPEELIDEAGSCLNLIERQGRLTEAYYYGACSLMADNKIEQAKKYLKKAVDLNFFEYYEFVSAKVMLEKI